MTVVSLPRALKEKALQLGFDRVGFADARLPEEARHFDRWLAAGMHGEMSWLERGRRRRLDPGLVLEGARSLIVVALAYASRSTSPEPTIGESPRGVVARYALGDDYHRVMGDRLAQLQRFLEAKAPGHRAKAYVDTGPLLERMWAARAGIGWVGKNSLVLNKEMGSYFLLGAIVTTLPLPPDSPATDQCGACTSCIEACPTSAIVEPRLVDSRRCLSYHTIELRGPIPFEYREKIGNRVFGCDDCQDACPWNHEGTAPEGSQVLAARPESVSPSLLDLLSMTRQEYQRRFGGSAIKRATYNGLRRNAAAALGHAKPEPSVIEALQEVTHDSSDDAVLKEQAAWAAARVKGRLASGPGGVSS